MLKRESNSHRFRHSVSPFANFCIKRVKHYSFSTDNIIGKGYSSSVFRAVNEITKQIVAMKIIDLNSLTDQVKKYLLRIQIQCLTKAQHPKLLRYIESFETKNNCYIITEFCQESDLQKKLRRKGKFSQRESMEIFMQIYQGYHHLHNCGYIHRDLKPANIFCKGKHYKIADFGFAKRITQNPQDSYNVGTTVYMAPESLNANFYSQKTDVWSLGIILYQLLHGRVPWLGNENQIRSQINNTHPYIDTTIVSQELSSFILGCLAINPMNRFSIEQMKFHPWFMKIKQRMNPQNEFQSYSHREKLRDEQFRWHKRKLTENYGSNQIRYGQRLGKSLVPIQPVCYGKQDKQNGYENFSKALNCQNQKVERKEKRITKQNIESDKKDGLSFFQLKKSVKKPKKSESHLILQKLISVLNFHRFQFKVHQFVKAQPSIKNRNFIIFELMKKLISSFHTQQNLIKLKQNPYDLPNWEQFIHGDHWAIYERVINQYSQKYSQVYQQICKQFQSNSEQSLKDYILSIDLKNLQEDGPSAFREIQCLCYLFTIQQIYSLVEKGGWHCYIEQYKRIVTEISQKKTIGSQNVKKAIQKLQKCQQKLKSSIIQLQAS